MNVLYFWIGTGIIFLIVEFFTTTFYGLSLALSAFVTAIVLSLFPDISLLSQGVVFALSSMIFAMMLPKVLAPKGEDVSQGLDRYVGMIAQIHVRGESQKITLEGVDYPIISDEVYSEGQKVQVTGYQGISLKVTSV